MKTKIILLIVLSLITGVQLSGQTTHDDTYVSNANLINYQVNAWNATVKLSSPNNENPSVTLGARVDSDNTSNIFDLNTSNSHHKQEDNRDCDDNSGCGVGMDNKKILAKTHADFDPGAGVFEHQVDLLSDTWQHESDPENSYNGNDKQRQEIKKLWNVTNQPSGWGYFTGVSCCTADKSNWHIKWRYTHGTKNSPLTFDALPPSGIVTHTNNNTQRGDFDGGMGYANEDEIGRAPDVHYTFNIDGEGREVTFSLENLSTKLAEYPHQIIMKLIGPDDTQIFLEYGVSYTTKLCAGMGYTLVVDGGFYWLQGQFTLKIETSPLSMNAGLIETADFGLCENASIGDIEASLATAVNYDPIVYAWQKSTDNGTNWDYIFDTNSANLIADKSGTMPGSDIKFRREAKSCGFTVYTNPPITITKQNSTINSGTIKFPNNEDLVKTSALSAPPQIESVVSGSGTPILATYRWEKEEDGGSWEEIAGVTSATYSPTAVMLDTKYRRVAINECGAEAVSNEVEVDVLEANGEIFGIVTSPTPGVPVKDIVITVTRESPVIGEVSGAPPAGNEIYTAITNANGEYRISNIYYGEKTDGTATAFTVVPSRLADGSTNNFAYAPGSSGTVFLDNNNREREQNIIDGSLFAVTGQVFQMFEGDMCGIDSVTVTGGTTSDTTSTDIINGNEVKGFYSLALTGGTYDITPEFGAHDFDPDESTITINGNTSGINFQDTTTHAISGFVGACGINQTELGNSKAQITFSSLDLCIQKILDVNSDGTYHLRLPARKYNVMVTNFDDPDPYAELDVLAFFQKSIEVDLTTDDVEQDFIYKPRPTLFVTGFPAPEPGCIDRVIMEQGETRVINIQVFEGDPSIACPLDTGLLLITDDISDRAGTIQEIPISQGMASYEILAGSPEIIAPHFKNISLVARDTTGQSIGFSQDVIVTGTEARDGTFTTVSPEIPMLILRDPPGDDSYAYIEKSETFETSTNFYALAGGSYNVWNQVKTGLQFESGFIGFDTETEAYGQVNNSFTVSGAVKASGEFTQTYTSTRKFQTNDDDEVVGAAGDVFVGAALNIIYAVSDVIEFDPATCLIVTDKRLMISPSGFETEYIYTKDHIENVVMTNLQFLADNGGGTSGDAEYRETADGLPQTPEFYLDQIKMWQQTLQLSDDLKDRAVAAGNLKKDNNPFSGNITLSANAGAEFTTTNSSSEQGSFEFNIEIEASVAVEVGLEVAGIGASGGANVTLRADVGAGTSVSSTEELTVGVVLGDDDTGDDFTADMLIDPVYKTPIFEVLSGRSSCPYEGLPTQPRDQPELSVRTSFAPAVQTGIPPNDEAEFRLNMKNNTSSVSDPSRTYELSYNDFSSSDFPAIKINSAEYMGPRSFTISAGATGVAQIKVARGSANVYNYEGMEFTLSSPCDPDFSETVVLSAFFDSPCSDISLEKPIDDWELTGGSNNIQVHIKDYDKANLDQIQIQYDTVGQSNWIEAAVIEKADLPYNNPNGNNLGHQLIINLASVPDGDYNIRAKLVCGLGSTSSERVRGRIKRTVPVVTGIPYPSDDEFDPMTDSLSVAFDETVSCAQATATITDVATDATFNTTVMCFVNTAVVYPVNTLPPGEYAVELCGMLDVLGNEIDCYTWYFNVGAIPEECGPLDVENNNADSELANSFTAIESGLYQGATVKSDNIIITPDGDVHFQGENVVTLDPGFEVPSNSVFLADIDDCDETIDDPIPCEFGIPITLGNFYTGDTNDAIPGFTAPTVLPGGTCNNALFGNSSIEWYYHRGQSLDVDFSVCGYVGFDISLFVFSGDCKEGLTCLDDESGPNASVGWIGELGTDYYIAVTGLTAADKGEYTMVFDTLRNTPLKAECNQIYVDHDANGANDGTSWTDAYTNLHDALADMSTFNAEVWVADGTYYTDTITNDREATFSLNTFQTIFGGLAGNEPKYFDMKTRDFEVNETILSGEMNEPQDQSDNSYHVVTYNQFAFDETPILDGLTIEGGYAASSNDFSALHFEDNGSQAGNTSDFVELPNHADFILTDGDFAIEAWVNPTTAGGFKTIASRGHGGGVANYPTEYVFSINNSNKLGIFFDNYNGLGEWIYGNTIIPLNSWTHVAVSVVYSAVYSDKPVVTFYVNGVADGGGTTSFPTLYDLTDDDYTGLKTFIGRQGDQCKCHFFDGRIDNLAFWNKTLTATDVVASMTVPPAGTEQDLIAYYNFTDGSPCQSNSGAITLTDQTPNGLDGTLINFELSVGCTSNWAEGYEAMGGLDIIGGGLYLEGAGVGIVENCTFRDNYAAFGGAVGSSNTQLGTVFVNTLFLDNTAQTGGAVYAVGGTNENYINSTFHGNQALGEGDAIAVSSATVNVTNSILWGNNPDSLGVTTTREPIAVLPSGNIIAENNIIENGSTNYGSTGDNQFTDPRFVNPDATRNLEDYRLQDGSPAIDAGIVISTLPVNEDHDGFSRSNGGAPDLGAYESGSACRDFTDSDGDAILDCEDLCVNTPDMSLDFDGVDDHITVSHDNDFNLSRSNFTIEAWVFVRDNSANTILSKGAGTSSNVFSLVVSPEGGQKLGLYLSSGFSTELKKSTTEIPLTTWTHVAVTFDLTNSAVTFYINGVKDGLSLQYSLASINSTDSDPLYIGRNGHVAADNYFKGRMDNLSIWSEALTDAQIATTMSARLAGSVDELGNSDLIVNYEFDDSPACVGGGNTLSAKFWPAGQRQGTLVDFDLNNGCTSNWAPGSNLDSDNGGRGDACEETSFVF